MKKGIAVIGLVCVSFLTIACNQRNKGDESFEMNMALEDEELEYIELTPEQEELLCKISVNEDKVKEGKLVSWQKKVIDQYNYVLNTLNEKYPSYYFTITDCTPKNKLNLYATFIFYENTEPEKYYECYLVEEEKYSAQDNFYGRVIAEDFADYIEELLAENNISGARVESKITAVQGKEFYEGMDLQKIFDGELKMSQRSEIYLNEVNSDKYAELIDSVKEILTERGVYGSYRVNISGNTEEILFRESFDTF